MHLKAVIMAGGEGTRLRPLTCTMPKPLVPVYGKPAMTHIIDLLARHNIREAAVTTMYMAENISDFYGDSYDGVKLRYFKEDIPLGTAGSIKNAEKFLDDDFIVISGDCVCDINITDAINYHYSKNADVTIVLSRVDEPLEYGVVMCDKNGKINRFIEKPSWSQAFSDTVNTGIYIIKHSVLDLIPENTFYDFSRDLFKKLLDSGAELYGCLSSGYWCDIGDINAFYRCSFELSDSDNIIGSNVKIADTAYLRGSIIFDGCEIGENTIVDGAIICKNVKLGNNVIVRPGCVIGEDSRLNNNVSTRKNIRIWNNKIIDDGVTVMNNIIFGDAKKDSDLFDEGGISGDTTALTPEYCVRLGQAAAEAVKYGTVGVMCGTGDSCRLICDALLCGIYAGGAKSYDFGTGFEAMAAYAASKFRLNLLIFVRENFGGSLRLTMYDADGLYPERGLERALAAAMARPDTMRKAILYPPEKFSSLNFMYYSDLAHSTDLNLEGLKVQLNSTPPSRILSKVLAELGASIGESGLYIEINDEGDDIHLHERGSSYKYDADMWHIAAIIEQAELNDGKIDHVILPYTAPACLEKIAADANIKVARYVSCPADLKDSSAAEIRALSNSQIWLKDACFAAVKICALIAREAVTVSELAGRIPEFYNTVSEYDAEPKYKTLIMKELGDASEEGVQYNFSRGNVKVIPKRRRGFRLVAEAVNAETAEEIISLTKKQIEELISKAE